MQLGSEEKVNFKEFDIFLSCVNSEIADQ